MKKLQILTSFIIMLLFIPFLGCKEKAQTTPKININDEINNEVGSTSIIVLGTIQDAGSPHIGCKKQCCKPLFENPDASRKVVSLGLFDSATNKKYLFDATPDISTQMKVLKNHGAQSEQEIADGIFLTHAHIGHYTGLMYLGKEATNASNIPVFAMPKMKGFLEKNGPWDQLVALNNITLNLLENEKPIQLSAEVKVIPFQVPHRDEYSETVGFSIHGPNKSAIFIPDIDKWSRWEKNIIDEIKKVDYAFLDATFFSGKEINNRDISQIPHPFVIESLALFKNLEPTEKKKIIFIHFNHTNPLIDENSEETNYVLEQGFNIARIGAVYQL